MLNYDGLWENKKILNENQRFDWINWNFVNFCLYTYACIQQFLPPLWAAIKIDMQDVILKISFSAALL